MYLSYKQILLLLLPLISSSIIYIMSDSIIQGIEVFFPKYTEYHNKSLDEKTEIYLKIEAKDSLYKDIIRKIHIRQDNANWIAKNLIYQKEVTVKKKKTPEVFEKVLKERIYKLSMVYPKKNIAIINSKVVKLNEYIYDAKVISIETSRVLLQFKTGIKWVYLYN